MHRLSGFVHQDDLFNGSLTVLEHITFVVLTIDHQHHSINKKIENHFFILFKANLRLDRRINRTQKDRLVHEILAQLGLMGCTDTRIGPSDTEKTLSGGEKKRVSFASELLTKPPLLFCDEPTTGLGAYHVSDNLEIIIINSIEMCADAYGAQQLVRILQTLARQGTTILCTIHQPSSQVFAMFHQVLFLAEGRTAFMGAPDEAVHFFAKFVFLSLKKLKQ